MSGMGKPGDQQTWVYQKTADSWAAGSTGGGGASGSSGTVIPGYPNANYAFVTSSNAFFFGSSTPGFVPVTNVSGTITTTGSPVLVMVNAFWNAQTAGAQAFFSLNRNGTNMGSQYSGLQGAGPTAQSYGNNASFAFVDFVPSGTYTYQMTASGSIGSGALGAWGVGPTAIAIFEMKNANVVTASTTLTQAVPGGNLIGLSASIFVNRGPVLCIGSTNMSSDANGNWCWFDIFRNGSSLANGAGQGLSVNVGSATNEIQGNPIFVMDTAPPTGQTVSYTMRATNGGGTNHVNTNNLMSCLILWELTDVNYKYGFSTSQITPATSPSYSDVDPQSPTQALITRGRPVLLLSNVNSNTSGGGGRNGYSFFRNGINLTTASKGMQLPDGEGNNDWNKMASTYWIDQVPAGNYQYQLEGTVVSSSAFTAQGSYTYLFMYELDGGLQNGNVFGGWLDTGGTLTTTASINVSGSVNMGGPLTVNNLPYLVGSGTIQVSTGSGGQVTVFTPTPAFATIATSETTTSTSYTDLATVGPSVSVTVGASGKLMLTFGAYISQPSNGWFGAVSPQLSGANTLAAADVNWVIEGSSNSAMYSHVSRTIVLSGLNPGVTVVTLKYKSGNSGFSQAFQDRDLLVTPL